MSKVDALRAMREARYAESQKRAAGGPKKPAARSAPVAPPRAKAGPASEPEQPSAAAADELCGHKSMNGRSCTRESGHAQKSHRYS